MVIYRTVNKINGKFYIGQESGNDPAYLGSGVILQRAIANYGKENFTKEILCECGSKSELDEKEKYYIELLDATNRKIAYNIAKGGGGVLGLKHSMGTRLKMSISKKEFMLRNPGYFEKLRKSHLGKKHLDSTRSKMSSSHRDRLKDPLKKKMLSSILKEAWKKKTPGQKKEIFNKMKQTRLQNGGYSHTEETKRRISEVQMGRTLKPETIQKIVSKTTGQKRSDSQKENISQGIKNYYATTPGAKEALSERTRKAAIDHPLTEETREKMRNAKKGRKQSEETREKRRQAMLRRYQENPELRAEKSRASRQQWEAVSGEARAEHFEKIAEKTRGRQVSKETQEKLSKALKGRKLSGEHLEKVRAAQLQVAKQRRGKTKAEYLESRKGGSLGFPTKS